MTVAIFGPGDAGLTPACCIAAQVHHVVGFNPNPRKLAAILSGTSPITEPKVQT